MVEGGRREVEGTEIRYHYSDPGILELLVL